MPLPALPVGHAGPMLPEFPPPAIGAFFTLPPALPRDNLRQYLQGFAMHPLSLLIVPPAILANLAAGTAANAWQLAVCQLIAHCSIAAGDNAQPQRKHHATHCEGKITECILWHHLSNAYGGLNNVAYYNQAGDTHLAYDLGTFAAAPCGATSIECKAVRVCKSTTPGKNRLSVMINMSTMQLQEISRPLGAMPPFSLLVGLFIIEHEAGGPVVNAMTFMRLDELYYHETVNRYAFGAKGTQMHTLEQPAWAGPPTAAHVTILLQNVYNKAESRPNRAGDNHNHVKVFQQLQFR